MLGSTVPPWRTTTFDGGQTVGALEAGRVGGAPPRAGSLGAAPDGVEPGVVEPDVVGSGVVEPGVVELGVVEADVVEADVEVAFAAEAGTQFGGTTFFLRCGWLTTAGFALAGVCAGVAAGDAGLVAAGVGLWVGAASP